MNIKKLKFVIVSPRQSAGGPIVLHSLCKFLSELGHDSRIFYIGPSDYRNKFLFWTEYVIFLIKDLVKLFLNFTGTENWTNKQTYLNGFVRESVKGCKRKWLPFVDEDTIVVYPEIVYGNFLNAVKVVRWLLYFNRFQNSNDWYEKNDLIISYREIFNDYKLNPQNKCITVAYFDLNLYKKTNYGQRKGKCYIIRKGQNRADLPQKFDGIIIDHLPETEKVKVFNECEYCISYDVQTAYSTIAAMCGCISVVVPEPGRQKKDYLGPNEEVFGVAYGFSKEELNYATNTQSKIAEVFQQINKNGLNETLKFTVMCQNYFT